MPFIKSENEPTLNPVVKILEYRKGKFKCYNKSKKETTEVDLDGKSLPILFTTISVGGYSKRKKAGIYSNQIQHIKQAELSVKCKGEEVANGYLLDIKDSFQGLGAYSQTNVYTVIDGEICQVVFKKSSDGGHSPKDDGNYEGGWRNFYMNNRGANFFTIDSHLEKESNFGPYSIPYLVPSEGEAPTQEQIDILTEYRDSLFSSNEAEQESPADAPQVEESVPQKEVGKISIEDIPF